MSTVKDISAELAKAKDRATIRKLRRDLRKAKEERKAMLFNEDFFNKRRGRKPLFRDHMFKEGRKLASLGLTVERLADFWQIDPATLWRWTKKNPAFCKTIKEAREAADSKVTESLFNRACGYQFEEKTFETTLIQIKPAADPTKVNAECFIEKEHLKKRVVKEVAPDTVACMFWLMNRQPEFWKDRKHHSIEAEDGKPIPIRFIRVVDPEKKDEMKKVDSGNGNGRNGKKAKKIKK